MGTKSLSPKDNFARAIRCPDSEINLSAASLYAASSESPNIDVIAYQGRIAQLGKRVKAILAPQHSSYDVASAMHEILFDQVGFKGDSKNYFDPKNSHLNEVIERCKGNPLALSILYIEVARVAGIQVNGIALRKHFVVAVGTGDEKIYVDPFHKGGLLSRKECLASILGEGNLKNSDNDELERKFLKPTSKRAIIRRLLSNIKVAHEKHKNYELALAASERIHLIDPANLNNLSDLAHLQTKVGNFGDAVDSLTQFLERSPAGTNTEQAVTALEKLRELTARTERKTGE